MEVPSYIKRNHLLAVLKSKEFEKLLPELELVQLESQTVVYESGKTMDHIYFPIDCVLRLMHLEGEGFAQGTLIGNDSAAGAHFVLITDATLNHAVVESPGHAYRLEAGTFLEKFALDSELSHLLLGQTQVLNTHLMQHQEGAVSAFEQRLCNWMLLAIDAIPENNMMARQALLAKAIGLALGQLYQAPLGFSELVLMNFKGEQV